MGAWTQQGTSSRAPLAPERFHSMMLLWWDLTVRTPLGLCAHQRGRIKIGLSQHVCYQGSEATMRLPKGGDAYFHLSTGRECQTKIVWRGRPVTVVLESCDKGATRCPLGISDHLY